MKFALLLAVLALAACGKKESPAGGAESQGGYDAARDAAADIANALAAAKVSQKRVLIEAGENSCPKCPVMRRFYDANPSLAAVRDELYVTVKVHAASGGPVPAALKGYPAPAGYPHLYVLDENGSLIQSQNTSELEKGDGYDLEKFTFFLSEFGTPQ